MFTVEDIEQDGVQKIIVFFFRIVLDDDIFQFFQFGVYLVVLAGKSGDVVFVGQPALQQLLYVRKDGLVFVFHVAAHFFGVFVKEFESNGLPTFISPWIDGKKAVMGTGKMTREDAVSVEQHEREWNEIFDGIHDVVDACAFQDGHIDYDELDAFFTVNKKLADKYGMQCWTNAETFDRDMPIRFLPIKFDKLRMKLEAAKRAGYDKAITFEFSHFLSPQSAYLQAGHLYDRYREYFEIK